MRSRRRCRGRTWCPIDVLGLEVGYRLIPLVDRGQDGELLRRIKGCARSSRRTSASWCRRCTSATTSSCARTRYRITLKGVEIGAAKSSPGCSRHQSRPRAGSAAGHADPRSGLRPAGGLGRSGLPRERAGAGLHGGRCQHRGRDAPVAASSRRTPPSCSAARRSQALLDHLAKDAPKLVEDLVPKLMPLAPAAEGAAEPARGGRAHPRHAHHPRDARRARAAHAGSRRADRGGARRAVACDPAARCSAGRASWRCSPSTRNWSRCSLRREPRGVPRAPGWSRGWPSACCARPASSCSSASSSGSPACCWFRRSAAQPAGALPAPRRAATEGAVAVGDPRQPHRPGGGRAGRGRGARMIGKAFGHEAPALCPAVVDVL